MENEQLDLFKRNDTPLFKRSDGRALAFKGQFYLKRNKQCYRII